MSNEPIKPLGFYFRMAVETCDYLRVCFDFETGKELDHHNGDTLAVFIGREIISLYDEDLTHEEMCLLVYHALRGAIDELGAVMRKFQK